MLKRVLKLGLIIGAWALPLAHAETLHVTPDWLHAHLQDSQLVVIDARPPESYAEDHITGAVNFPDSLTYQQKSSGGTIVEPMAMQALLRARGIDQDKLIVVYDAGQLLDAARVFWVLEVYGLNQVRLLSPGYAAWVKRQFAVTKEVPTPTPSQYIPTINHKRIASKFTTQLATVNPEQSVIDARDADSYQGKKSSAARFGHIPSAVNFPATHNFGSADGMVSLRGIEELQAQYSTLPKGKKIILYCEIGRASAANYLVLRELGYDVANYDGSWREWGNDLTLPIEK